MNHISHHMFNWRGFDENQLHDENIELTSGRPNLHVEGQFILSHLSSSHFVLVKTIEARNMQVLQKAFEKRNAKQRFEVREVFILTSS